LVPDWGFVTIAFSISWVEGKRMCNGRPLRYTPIEPASQ
jgi:hypothetical protein